MGVARTDNPMQPEHGKVAQAARNEVRFVTSPAPRDTWASLLDSSPHALAFQTPAWMDSLCQSGGYEDASRLYDAGKGRQLLLPMARRKGLPRLLAAEASLPFGWGFGGLLSPGELREGEIGAVLADLGSRAILQTSIRPNPLESAAWEASAPAGIVRVPRTAHVLDLEGGFQRVWENRFGGTARTAVRKAQRSSLEVVHDTTGALVPIFYDLYRQSLDRWANQGQVPAFLTRWRSQWREPQRKFQIVAESLGGACRIWVAKLHGQAVAAIIVLLQGANASYWRGAMNKEIAGPTRASDWLQSLAIEDACRAGCRYYHMGESGSSVSLAQFKARFGAEAHPYVEYRLERLPITRQYDRAVRLGRGLSTLLFQRSSSLG